MAAQAGPGHTLPDEGEDFFNFLCFLYIYIYIYIILYIHNFKFIQTGGSGHLYIQKCIEVREGEIYKIIFNSKEKRKKILYITLEL